MSLDSTGAPGWWPRGVESVPLERSSLHPFNAALPRETRWVARPGTLLDLQRIVRACAWRGVRVGVWGAGFGAQQALGASVLLDLHRLEHLTPRGRRRVRVGPGVSIGALDALTAPRALAAVAPRFSHLSVLGAVLGGGTGWLSRRHGFAAEGITSARLVLPDGRLTRVDEEHEPELLWALRGAGQGGFGVVTSVDLELHPIPPRIWAGKVSWPLEQAPQVLRGLQALLDELGDELFVFAHLRSRGAVFELSGVHLGPLDVGARVFDRLSSLAPGSTSDHGARTYLEAQSEFRDPAGRTPSFRWRHGFVRRGEVLAFAEAVVEGLRRHSGLELRFNLESLGGAFRRPEPRRLLQSQDAGFLYVAAGVWDAPEDERRTLEALEAIHEALSTTLLPHGHPNYDDVGVADRASFYFGDHAPRLRALRERIDPGGVFYSVLDE